jgi:hypothetical protein
MVCVLYTVGSLSEGRADTGVFSDTLDKRESCALGSLATVFWVSAYMHNITFCLCSDSKAALLALSLILIYNFV